VAHIIIDVPVHRDQPLSYMGITISNHLSTFSHSSSTPTVLGTRMFLNIHSFPFSGHTLSRFSCLSAGPVGPEENFACPKILTCLLSLVGYSWSPHLPVNPNHPVGSEL
jgi:hypothetical protein